MPANIPNIIGAGTAKDHVFRVGKFLNTHFVKSGVIVVFNPKYNIPGKLIMLYHFYIAKGMDFFSSPDHFIRPVVVNIFYKMW